MESSKIMNREQAKILYYELHKEEIEYLKRDAAHLRAQQIVRRGLAFRADF